MKSLIKWAPLGGAICLIVAAIIIGNNSRRDVKSLYDMLRKYE